MGHSSSGSDTWVSNGGRDDSGSLLSENPSSTGMALTHHPPILASSSSWTDGRAVGGSVPAASSQRQGSLCPNRATSGPAQDLHLSPLSLQTLLFQTVPAAAPFIIPGPFSPWRLLRRLPHKSFAPRDPSHPINHRRVGPERGEDSGESAEVHFSC